MKKALLIVSVAVFGLSFGGGEQAVSTFTDKRDGKVYRIVKIGGQSWFAENLNYAAEGSVCYGEGGKVNSVTIVVEYDKILEPIPTTTLSNTEVQANCKKYGRLYNWETALKACPAGTHLPSDDEWTILVDYVGGEEKAGTKLKSSRGWESYCYETSYGEYNFLEKRKCNSCCRPVGTNNYGFSALPGGCSNNNGRNFSYAEYTGMWWSATEYDALKVWGRYMYNHSEEVGWYTDDKTSLNSVRCVLDNEKEKRK
jgi:uncharacterized protein (TIGR02145 family)